MGAELVGRGLIIESRYHRFGYVKQVDTRICLDLDKKNVAITSHFYFSPSPFQYMILMEL